MLNVISFTHTSISSLPFAHCVVISETETDTDTNSDTNTDTDTDIDIDTDTDIDTYDFVRWPLLVRLR